MQGQHTLWTNILIIFLPCRLMKTKTQVKVTVTILHLTQAVPVIVNPKMSTYKNQGHSHVLTLKTGLSNRKRNQGGCLKKREMRKCLRRY